MSTKQVGSTTERARWLTMLKGQGFDAIDREIFGIEDGRTRALALQRYFFPKLLVLLNSASSLIKGIYGEQSLDHFTEARRPKPKGSGYPVSQFDDVHLGLIGMRVPEGLRVKSASGKPIEYGISALYFEVMSRGTIAVTFRPVVYGDDRQFEARVSKALSANYEALLNVCSAAFVSSDAAMAFDAFEGAISPEHLRRFRFFSAGIDFPVRADSGLTRLVVTFAALFPFQKLITDLSMGVKPSIETDIEALDEWWQPNRMSVFAPERTNIPREPVDETEPEHGVALIDSSFAVSGRQRWRIFERDDWRCKSCGRAPGDGTAITLHIDHIKPRSLGGADDDDNLQTLCSECNLGKGNTSSRDLRTQD